MVQPSGIDAISFTTSIMLPDGHQVAVKGEISSTGDITLYLNDPSCATMISEHLLEGTLEQLHLGVTRSESIRVNK